MSDKRHKTANAKREKIQDYKQRGVRQTSAFDINL